MAFAAGRLYDRNSSRQGTPSNPAYNSGQSTAVTTSSTQQTLNDSSPVLPIQNPADFDRTLNNAARAATISSRSDKASITTKTSSTDSHQSSKSKSKAKNAVMSFFTLKDPSIAAYEEFAKSQKQQQANINASKKNSISVISVSSQKLPETVPKVNSKWDGLPTPHSVARARKSGERRDSGVAGRIPFSLHTASAANIAKTSSNPATPCSPYASSNALPDDNKRKEFPLFSSTSSSQRKHRDIIGSSSNPSHKSPAIPERLSGSGVHVSKPDLKGKSPILPMITSTTDEPMFPLSHADNSTSTSYKHRTHTDEPDSRGRSSRQLYGPFREPPKRSDDDVSRARVQAFLDDQAAHRDQVLLHDATTEASMTRFDYESTKPEPQVTGDPQVENSKGNDERPRSTISANGSRIRYSLQPADTTTYRHSRQTSSSVQHSAPQPYSSHSASSSVDSKRSQPVARRNFSRPLASTLVRENSPDPIRTPAEPNPGLPKSRFSLSQPQQVSDTDSVPLQEQEMGKTRRPGTHEYYDREPSRELRRPNHTTTKLPVPMEDDVDASVTSSAKEFASSTAFWETAAQRTEEAIHAGRVQTETAGIPSECRLDGPFDPALEWH